jgi:hypothetical protein
MICRLFVAAVLVALSAYGGHMVSDREIPFVRYSGEIAPLDPAPGDTVVVTWHGHRYRDCPGVVYRRITDSHGEVHNLAAVGAVYSETSNPDPLPRTFRLPAHIASGSAEYVATTVFYCNPLHQIWPIVVDTPPIAFTIAQNTTP